MLRRKTEKGPDLILSALARAVRDRLRYRMSVTALGMTPVLALAGPVGEHVVAGSAAVERPDAASTLVYQSSQKAILNWRQFSIGAEESVQFFQPSPTSVMLNRVVGGAPSRILGRLSANGRVFLVNPQGIYFGAGAAVDVAGLVASVDDINDQDFLDGRYIFSRDASAPAGASVVNDGVIRAPGGFVVLAGDYVSNSGLITANLGQVVLASGSQVTMDFNPDGLISFEVNQASLSQLAGVQNAGRIIADGGKVLMTASVADDLVSTAVNNRGLVRANSAVEKNGEVYLVGKGGDVENSGVISAAGAASGADGGHVAIHGDKSVNLEAGGSINADGAIGANGGSVRLVAGDRLRVDGGATVTATQGAAGARGGLVELSGHTLKVRGKVKAGRGGALVIDPGKLTITSGSGVTTSGSTVQVGVGYIQTKLNSGQKVDLVASSSIGHSTGVTSITALDSAGSLALKTGTLMLASGSVYGSLGPSGCSATGVCTQGYSVAFSSDNGTINLAGVNIDMAGRFTANAGFGGRVSLGDVSARAGVDVTANSVDAGNVSAASGRVDVFGFNHANLSNVSGKTGVGLSGGLLHTANVTAASGGVGLSANGSGSLISVGKVSANTYVHIAVYGGYEPGVTAAHVAKITAGGLVTVSMHTHATASVSINGNVTGKAVNMAVLAGSSASGAPGAGLFVRGNVKATGTSSGDGVAMHVAASGSGNVGSAVVSGSVSAAGGAGIQIVESGNAMLSIYSSGVHVSGAMSTPGPVSISATGGISVSDVTAPDISIHGGRYVVAGNVTASNSIGPVSVNLVTGPSASSGTITVGTVTAQGQASSPGSAGASVSINAGGNSSADVSVGAVNADGAVRITAGAGKGSINVGGAIKVTSGTADLVAGASSGGISVNGVISADKITLRVSPGTGLNLKTGAPLVQISDGSGGGTEDITIDNQAYTGAASIEFNGGGSLSAHDVALLFGGSGSIGNDFSVNNILISTERDALLNGHVIQAATQANFAATGDIMLGGAQVAAEGTLVMTAGGGIHDAAGTRLSGGGMLLAAGSALDLPATTVDIGNGVSGAAGDTALLNLLQAKGVSFSGSAPNGAFIASAGLDINTVNPVFMGNGAGQLLFQAGSINIVSVGSYTTNLLVQFAPFHPDNTLGVENSSPGGCGGSPCDVNLTLNGAVGKFTSGGTVVIGNSDQTGALWIGSNGALDFRAAGMNVVFVTAGGVDNMFTSSPAFPGVTQSSQVVDVTSSSTVKTSSGKVVLAVDPTFSGSGSGGNGNGGGETGTNPGVTPGTVDGTIPGNNRKKKGQYGENGGGQGEEGEGLVEQQDEVGNCQ